MLSKPTWHAGGSMANPARPLPTPQDRLFFLLTYLKTYSLQVVQGRLFGMSQGKANQ
jgi:hypothetical protein